jgi:hypothetical protein
VVCAGKEYSTLECVCYTEGSDAVDEESHMKIMLEVVATDKEADDLALELISYARDVEQVEVLNYEITDD